MGRIVSLLPPVLAILFAFTSFGAAPIVLRKYGSTLNPVAYISLRATSAVPLLFLAATIAERAKPLRPRSWTQAALIVVIGFATTLAALCGVVGVLFSGASVASVFFMSAPATSTLLAIATRTEPVPPVREARGLAKIGGITITVLGAILLVVGAKKSKESECRGGARTVRYDDDRPTVGAVLLAASVISSSVYFVLTKRFFLRYPQWKNRAISSSAWIGFGMVISLLFIMPVGLIIPHHTCSGQKIHIGWSDLWRLTGEEIYAVEYATILCACLGMMLIAWTLSKLPASVTSAFVPVGQMVGVVLAAVLLGETLTALQYTSIVLITGGLFLVIWAQYKEERLQKLKQNQDDEGDGEIDSLQEFCDDLGSVEGDQLQLLPMEGNASQRTSFNGLVLAHHVSLADLDDEDEL